MTNKENNILANKLDTLIRLVSIAICQNRTQKEQISLLNSAGIGPKVIAEILDTTPNNVSVTLSGLRKSKRKQKQHVIHLRSENIE
jgi:hypothetical protein